MIALLDDVAGDWLTWTLDRAIAATIVFLVVAVIAVALKRVASAHLLSWMWLLPLVPLIAPVERLVPMVESEAAPRAVMAAIGDQATGGASSSGSGAAARVGTAIDLDGEGGAVAAEAPARLHAPAWIMLAWGAVVLALLARFAVSQIRWSLEVRRCETDDGALGVRVRRLARCAGVRSDVRVACCDMLTSPATSGWLRPVILLPTELARSLSPAQLRWVLLHELAHIRRGDLLVAFAQRLVQIAWWWHPAAWMANAAVARHRECACDDSASARTEPGARRSCAEAFFEVVAASAAAHSRPPALASLVDHGSQLRRRLMRLLDVRRPVVGGTTPSAALAVICCAALAFTVAGAQQPAQAAAKVAGAVAQIDVPAEPRAAAKEAVRRAVAWLVKHQQRDGRWRVSTESGVVFNGMETEASTTARAVLALMDADRLVGSDDSRAAMARGLAWLEKAQTEEGCIGGRHGTAWTYGHALGTLALCAAEKRGPVEGRLDHIRSATRFILKLQNPYKGWRYGERDGDNDSKITSLMLMALYRAQALGVEVPRQSFQWARGYIEELIDPETGRVGWVRRGGVVGRLYQTRKTHPAESSEEVTALSLVEQMESGTHPATDIPMQRGISLVFRKLPEWSNRRGTTDYAYWYWGARLFRKLGGWQKDAWHKAALEELGPHVRWLPDGTATFPLTDAWSLPGLEAYATAVCIRTLCAIL